MITSKITYEISKIKQNESWLLSIVLSSQLFWSFAIFSISQMILFNQYTFNSSTIEMEFIIIVRFPLA